MGTWLKLQLPLYNVLVIKVESLLTIVYDAKGLYLYLYLYLATFTFAYTTCHQHFGSDVTPASFAFK